MSHSPYTILDKKYSAFMQLDLLGYYYNQERNSWVMPEVKEADNEIKTQQENKQ